jgi:5-methylcytosine-specific restriction enzyme subunit McrC
METIPLSSNINRDFAVCKGNRLMKDYKNILIWCGLFLNTESFIPFQGSNIAFAILFDMNKVFEDYVTRQLRLELSGFIVHPQDQRHYLFEELSIYKLKPDIFLEREDACIVVDTKWKLINNERDVSQADLYQMYAYLNKYEKTNDAIIIFPQNGNACERSYYYYYDKNKSQKAHIFFLNLENNNLSDIEDVILNCNLKTSNNPIKS